MSVRSVLIVDDNPRLREAICAAFQQADFEVCGEAENGKEAIEQAKKMRPSLIVTDLSMPVMNGLEETRILKKLMPEVPVILFTVHGNSTVEKEAMAAGAAAVVPKSRAETLVETARQLLDGIVA